MERWDLTLAANNLGGRVPRKRVLVSDSCPVILSTCVLSNTPFANPAGDHNFVHLRPLGADGCLQAHAVKLASMVFLQFVKVVRLSSGGDFADVMTLAQHAYHTKPPEAISTRGI